VRRPSEGHIGRSASDLSPRAITAQKHAQSRAGPADSEAVSRIGTFVDGTDVSLGGPRDGLLCVQGEPVAAVPDPDAVSVIAARVGTAAPLPELVGILSAGRPQGIMVLSNADESHSLALALRDGRVVSVAGPEPLQSLGPWLVELHRRYGHVSRGVPSEDASEIVRALDPPRTFIIESVLEAFDRCDVGDARMLLVLGDAMWLHEEIDPDVAPDLAFLLVEHARRIDEMAGVSRALGGTRRTVTPIRRPPDRRHAQDPWVDARYVFGFCDGLNSIETLVERTMIGRYRTLSALQRLQEHGHVMAFGDACELDDQHDLLATLA